MSKWIFITSVLLIVSSCKSIKTSSDVGDVKKTSANQLVKNYQNAVFKSKTLQAKLITSYEDGKNTQNLTVKLRMEKDKVIWLSATYLSIPVAKVKITPDLIQYYEKINKTYFEGDFELIKNAFGIEMSFENIQNLLLGQALNDIAYTSFDHEIVAKSYKITPKKQTEIWQLFYMLNPSIYKLDELQVDVPNTATFSVSYPDYQKIGKEWIPLQINILSKQTAPQKNTKIDMEVVQVNLNQSLNFPFSIPSGYERIYF